MSRKRASNGARNQLRGDGSIDARWHTKNIARRRKRNKTARASRRKNRT